MLNKISIVKFRTHDDMEVLSGAIGYEKTHYVAPLAKLDLMKKLSCFCSVWKFKNKKMTYLIY